MPFNRMIACATMASALVLAAASAEARPKTVDGPGYLPECFAATGIVRRTAAQEFSRRHPTTTAREVA